MARRTRTIELEGGPRGTISASELAALYRALEGLAPSDRLDILFKGIAPGGFPKLALGDDQSKRKRRTKA